MAITIDGTNGLSSDNAALKLDGTTLAIDETNNRVGVGTASPAVAMDVVGQVRASTGILFGSDTAAANALDDYEEGTWTPTVRGGATAGTYTLSGITAFYTKIGNQVTLWTNFGFSAASGGSNYIEIGGLPFSYRAQASIAGGFIATNLNTSASSSNGIVISNAGSGVTNVLFPFLVIDNAGIEIISITGVTTSTTFVFSLTYVAA